MKKILKSFALLILFFINFSCTKDLEYGTNFNFTTKEVDTNPYIKDAYKDVSIELIDVFGKDPANYYIGLKKTEGTATIAIDGFELRETDFYPISFIDNKALIKIKPTSFGLIKFSILIKDSNGIVREKLMQISTNTFTFTATSVSTTTPIFANNTASIDLNILNTGNQVGNNYQIKYTSNDVGVFKIGSTTLIGDTYVSINSGQSLASYTTSTVGLHNVALTVKNAQGIESSVILPFEFLPSFAVISFPITPLEAKESIIKQFQMNRNNLIGTYVYQMKFSSDKPCLIYDVLDNPIPLDTYVSIPSTNGVFTYKYLTNQGQDANLTVSIKNQLNTIIDKVLPIDVNPSPVITSVIAGRNVNSFTCNYGTLIESWVLGTGETIAGYEITIFDPNNGTHTVYYSQNVNLFNQPCNDLFTYFARIKDSSGRWSQVYSGPIR